MEREVTLMEVLDAREKRACRQKELLAEYEKTLISFTMNIAGPIKYSEAIDGGFRLGWELLLAQLKGSGIPVLYQEQTREATGCEGFLVVDASGDRVKALTVELEDSIPVGRLFDMDVLDNAGKYDRSSLGLGPRRCLLCDQDAAICGRSRAHTVPQLQEKTNQLLMEALTEQTAEKIGQLAVQALLYEVCTTPKPGLVDCRDSGSHRDMDIFTFMSSTAALGPYFTQCARIGIRTQSLAPTETFRQLRLPGKLAEGKMFQATQGVNTHKGAIFTLGILCGAAGRNPQRDLLAECAAMTKGVSRADLGNVTQENAQTAGQRLYARYGITGVRGQAEAGFPAVRKVGLPVLEAGLAQGKTWNEAGCAALLALLVEAEDTNLIARSDRQTQQQVCEEIRDLLLENPYPEEKILQQLNDRFVERNLSPGGSADLLAATYFLHFWKENQET